MIPDHPTVHDMLTTGHADDEEKVPVCPVCGAECTFIYQSRDGTIAGCDECMTEHDAWGVAECFDY